MEQTLSKIKKSLEDWRFEESKDSPLIIRRKGTPWLYDVFFGDEWDAHILVSYSPGRGFKTVSGRFSVHSNLARSIQQSIEDKWYSGKSSQSSQENVSENQSTP